MPAFIPSPPSGVNRCAASPAKNTRPRDRKSTRLNSSHSQKSYAGFCLKKKPPGTLASLLSVLYYEFLWNIRKKNIIAIFIIIFAIATVQLAFAPIADAVANPPQTLQANSTFVFGGIEALTGIFLFLVGVATTMNTVSGEFESGTIVPLLTKPVSKTLVFVAKIVASVITLLAAS